MPKSIKTIGRILQITKRPKAKNLNRRNVSISQEEANEVDCYDTVLLKVYNSNQELIAEKTFTGEEFHLQLVGKSKITKNGHRIYFYLLEY